MEERKLLKKKKFLQSKDDKLSLAAVCNNLAELYFREGKYELAVNEYKHEASLYNELNQRIRYAQANRMIGEMYTAIAEFEKAKKYQRIHLVVAQEEGNKLEEQRALASIGRLYLTCALSNPEDIDQNSLQVAYDSFMKSLLTCESLTEIKKQEQMDMRARLLLNMGVVKENQNNFNEGIEYMQKSIKICKTYEIYEQLHHGYSTLGMLYFRKDDHSKAISYLNLALETAERLSDKIPPMCTTLVNKSEVLIKLAEFQSARQCLLKAYKLKPPNQEERQTIQHNLKVVAAMCAAEDSLLTIADSNYNEKKKLYEKMGDGACHLKNYVKAIDYYKKMLECAEAAGESGKDLIPAYVSLAQTYKDNKQYDFALTYFKKEHEITSSNPKESYKTLLSIGEILVLLNKDFNEIAQTYEKAREQAQATGEMRSEKKVILAYINVLRKHNKYSEISALEKEIIMMNCESSDSEQEDTAETPDIGNDISISDISDLSDNNDAENTSKQRQLRKRNKAFAVRKNMKGESPLHVACIANNINMVKQLLEQGHPINVRDNCGWLPLHEASNRGFTEIVRVLLDKGAWVSDRGGTLCEGITPLHDAAGNGHMEIVELLLDRGASALAQTHKGETPLDWLKVWHQVAKLDETEETYYETLVSRLTSMLEKAGRPVTKQTNEKSEKENFDSLEGYRKSSRNKRSYINNNDEDDVVPSCSGYSRKPTNSLEMPFSRSESPVYEEEKTISSVENSAREEYKKIMDNLRNRMPEKRNKMSPKARSGKKSALVTNDVGDDWLEDDIGINKPTKKRKTDASVTQNLLTTSGMKRSNSLNSSKGSVHSNPTSPLKNPANFETYPSIADYQSPERTDTNLLNLCEYSNDSEISHLQFSDTDSYSNKKRKNQLSLLESGFTRRRSDSASSLYNASVVTPIRSKSYKRQPKITSFGSNQDVYDSELLSPIDSNPTFVNNSVLNTTYRSLIPINVQIEDKLWRIPIPADDIDNLTIGWLANEAAKRYYKKEGISPTLQLETKGAILENEDPLSMVFMSSSESHEVQSTILSWDLPPLPERYIQSCNNCKIEVNSELRERLEECQGTLNLKLTDFCLDNQQFTPLLRALKRQNNLQHIDLSGNTLVDDNLQQLSTILPTIIQLRSLNLSFNCISGEGLRYLSEMFTNATKPILENLCDLNLSFNSLGDICLQYLAVVLNHVKLRALTLTGCNLTNHIFEKVSNRGINLNFDHLENLDLSYNEMDSDSIIIFISFLSFNIINNLDFSHNRNAAESGIVREIATKLQQADISNLKSLNLARCKVNDPEIWDLLCSLVKSGGLDYLNLSYNPDLTSVSLRRLLQHRPAFSNLCLEGCVNITQYLDQCSFNISSIDDPHHRNTLKCLKISIDYEKNPEYCNILTTIWEKEWGLNAKIEKMFGNFLHLSVSD